MLKKNIILLGIAAILVYVGFCTKDASKQTKAIKNAVYVSDGLLLQENEGKRVIVSGVIRPDGAVVDELTGVEFDAIKVDRLVEKYTLVLNDEEDEEDYYEWNSTNRSIESNSSESTSSFIYATCNIGDFTIDEKMLSSLQVPEKVSVYDDMVIARKGYYPYRLDDVVYISRYFYLPEDGFTRQEGRQFEGLLRISYKINPVEENKEYTFIGIQENGKLVADKDLGSGMVYEGKLTANELVEKVEKGATIGAYVAWAIAGFLVFIAFYTGKK